MGLMPSISSSLQQPLHTKFILLKPVLQICGWIDFYLDAVRFTSFPQNLKKPGMFPSYHLASLIFLVAEKSVACSYQLDALDVI